jgi:hypothetical protein
MIDRSQRIAARVVGITYPLMFVVVTGAFFRFFAPLLAGNNAAQTARNIMANEHAFRIYLAATLIYGVGMVVLLTALYVILRPVGRGLALFAALSRLVYAFLWLVMVLDFFGVLRIMGSSSYLQAFEPDRLPALAGLRLSSGWDAYYIGLMFYGLGSVVFSYLWFKSRYIPRTLAAWGVFASLFAGFCAFAYLVLPSFGKIVSVNWYEIPIGLFEMATSFWVLARGLRPPETVRAPQATS